MIACAQCNNKQNLHLQKNIYYMRTIFSNGTDIIYRYVAGGHAERTAISDLISYDETTKGLE